MTSTVLRGSIMRPTFCRRIGFGFLLTVNSYLSVLVTSFSLDDSGRVAGDKSLKRTLSRPSQPWHPRRSTSSMQSMTTRSNQDANKEIQLEEEFGDILPFEKGSHNSAKLVIPSSDTQNSPFANDDSFQTRLESTIAACRGLGKSSIWVHVPMARASLIEHMVASGLRFHHATGTEAVLNLWLRESESKIPEYATHNVGVGAVVINSRNEILCVRELRQNYMPWKMPTGLTELGESLDEAAIREVLEETGVPTTFHSVLSFRQTHGLAHGRSDMFFVCRLNLVEQDDASGNVVIPEPAPQACEIETAQWVPYEDYRKMVMDPEHGHPMMQRVLRVLENEQFIQKEVVGSVVPGRKPNDVYFPFIDLST